jgi:hypothetical protein
MVTQEQEIIARKVLDCAYGYRIDMVVMRHTIEISWQNIDQPIDQSGK